ncbi:hypothetical protein PO124_07335 [Bacillus licheniformis]|nr:hypothetical protein [Bacillus licheniformis]
MVTGNASPAQTAALLIAERIKRSPLKNCSRLPKHCGTARNH